MTENDRSPFPESRALRMFPTVVWKAELEPDVWRPIDEAVMGALAELAAPLAELAPGESWQSAPRLHERADLGRLVARILDEAQRVLDHLKVGRAGLAITGCWANVSARGAGHRMHSHPNNYLSGVYYVRTQAGADTINFHDPRAQTAIVRPPTTELTADNADQVVVTVAAGTLLLFPAWLPHSVDPNRGDGARVSVSFNLMLSPYVETMSAPGWEGGRRRPL